MNKLHIGYHKTGSTFLQKLIFPQMNNYKGRYYSGDEDLHSDLYKGFDPLTGCENILKHYSNFNNIFISNELFTKIRPNELFELIEKYNFKKILVVEREFDSIIESRTRHKSGDFYLMSKLNKGIIDDEVKLHYSVDNLRKNIDDLTVISYEKLFGGDLEEIDKLSEYLEFDIKDIFLKNINVKVNARK